MAVPVAVFVSFAGVGDHATARNYHIYSLSAGTYTRTSHWFPSAPTVPPATVPPAIVPPATVPPATVPLPQCPLSQWLASPRLTDKKYIFILKNESNLF